MKPLPQVRHAYILNELAAAGSVQVNAIAAALSVSEMTIRRDLLDLESEGKLNRIHGGAVDPAAGKPLKLDREEPTFESRLKRHRAEKDAIAAAAAELCVGCRSIALDVGTTTYLLAGRLKDRSYARIFTNSVRIGSLLHSAAAEVYLPGGRVRRDEMSIIGATAIAQFQALWFDIAFIGVSGFTANGLYDYSLDDLDMKRTYLQKAKTKVALCDSSKFQHMSLVHVADLREIDILITNAEPPAALAAALAAAGVAVRIAPSRAAAA
jgi:DeoR family glycerol-3-phosphate regulon repressor